MIIQTWAYLKSIGNSNFVFSLYYAMRTHHRGIYLLAKHDTLTYDEKLQRNNNIYKDKNYVKNLGSSHMNNDPTVFPF